MQSTLEDALRRITGEDIRIVASGRTDAGAHAFEQIVAFSTGTSLSPMTLQQAMNATLPRTIAVSRSEEVESDFHPRHDAISRTYRYLIWNRPVRSPFMEGRAAHVKPHLDENAMHVAIQRVIGRNDFTSFVPANLAGSRERTVYNARCYRDGWMVTVEIEANGFMRQMIRSMVGTLIEVGRGKLDVGGFARILVARNRLLAGTTAPAGGLYLIKIRYAGDTTSAECISGRTPNDVYRAQALLEETI